MEEKPRRRRFIRQASFEAAALAAKDKQTRDRRTNANAKAEARRDIRDDVDAAERSALAGTPWAAAPPSLPRGTATERERLQQAARRQGPMNRKGTGRGRPQG